MDPTLENEIRLYHALEALFAEARKAKVQLSEAVDTRHRITPEADGQFAVIALDRQIECLAFDTEDFGVRLRQWRTKLLGVLPQVRRRAGLAEAVCGEYRMLAQLATELCPLPSSESDRIAALTSELVHIVRFSLAEASALQLETLGTLIEGAVNP